MSSTTRRGLGWQHQKIRRTLIPGALGTPCPGPYQGERSPNCVGIMTDPRHIDIDEDPPRALGPVTHHRACCSPCNRQAGGKLGAQLRWHKRPNPSRDW